MYGYERPGTDARTIMRAKDNPDYKGQTECIGYEASIGGLMYSTQHATLIAGPKEKWSEGYVKAEGGTPRYYKTKSGRFFKLVSSKIEVIGQTEMLDIWRNHWSKEGTEVEIFGTRVEYA